jgi:hypothetical protein
LYPFTREKTPRRPQFERPGGFSAKGVILRKYSYVANWTGSVADFVRAVTNLRITNITMKLSNRKYQQFRQTPGKIKLRVETEIDDSGYSKEPADSWNNQGLIPSINKGFVPLTTKSTLHSRNISPQSILCRGISVV